MSWIAVMTGGDVTVSEIDPLPVRPCASATVNGNDFAPGVVPRGTVAANVKVLAPLSTNACVAEPPIALRFAVTVSPVLVGVDPGVTATVKLVPAPADTVAGFAVPT